jgi:molecular chaperone GrpE
MGTHDDREEVTEEIETPSAPSPEDAMAETLAEDQPKAAEDQSPDLEDNQEMIQLKEEAAKNLEGWQRTLAEFQNYKRRTEREREAQSRRSALDTLTKLLPIIDDFERAMANVPEELAGNPWLNGVRLIQDKFARLLAEHDVTVLDPVGEPFDPNLHQAIGMDDSDEFESGHVIETLQKGYASGDVLLRPAVVRVAN